MTNQKATAAATLPLILIAAVIEGWALYGLHMAIKNDHWPATEPGWLMAFYILAVFVPLTAQLLAEHSRQKATWIIIAALGALFCYFAWHHGAMVMAGTEPLFNSDEWVPLGLVLTVLWLLILPFIQARLSEGDWRPRYPALFAFAWRNALTLSEAVLFTALFSLLLLLWAKLFDLIGIDFFEELFLEPIFIYPVTALAFGCALHLIGSVERLTSVILEQGLNVLKWLATIAGLILALFTLALLFKLPGMFSAGVRTISAAWLLWLVAVTVLLLNAAFRDGSVEQPYPRVIALALRLVVPLTVIIAFTALYAMYLRIADHGVTVTRVWALVVAVAACIYSVGYSIAARRPGRWMAGIAQINVIAALFLIATLALALTPVLSPYRIAANSQFHRAHETLLTEFEPRDQAQSPLPYLRFHAGNYGIARLEDLMQLQDHPHAAEIRRDAQAVRERKDYWQPAAPPDLEEQLAGIRLYPESREIDAGLRATLVADLKDPELNWLFGARSLHFGGTFIDLNDDGQAEFVLVTNGQALAYTQSADSQWRRAGRLSTLEAWDRERLLAQLLGGDFEALQPAWKELRIGRTVFRLDKR